MLAIKTYCYYQNKKCFDFDFNEMPFLHRFIQYILLIMIMNLNLWKLNSALFIGFISEAITLNQSQLIHRNVCGLKALVKIHVQLILSEKRDYILIFFPPQINYIEHSRHPWKQISIWDAD